MQTYEASADNEDSDVMSSLWMQQHSAKTQNKSLLIYLIVCLPFSDSLQDGMQRQEDACAHTHRHCADHSAITLSIQVILG